MELLPKQTQPVPLQKVLPSQVSAFHHSFNLKRFLWPIAPPCLVPAEWQLCHWWQSRNLPELFKGFVSPRHVTHQEYRVSGYRLVQNATVTCFSSGLDPWVLPQPVVCPVQELPISELLFHAESTSSSLSASIFPDNISWRVCTCSLQVSGSKLSQHVSVFLCISVGKQALTTYCQVDPTVLILRH